MADGFLELAAFIGRNSQKPQAGDFRRIGFQRFIRQRLQLRGPLLVTGEIQRLRPLAEQLRLTPSHAYSTLKRHDGIGGTFLRHVGTAQEVPAFRRLRVALYCGLQACGHFFDSLRLRGKNLRTLNIANSTPMLIEAIPQQRHQQRGYQWDGAAQLALGRLRQRTLSIREQLASGLVTTTGQLLSIQRPSIVLALQIQQALLIKSHVEGRTVFFSLHLASTQHRDQQKRQGRQQQQASAQPEFNHQSFLSTGV